ncbi:MAG: HAMP domain-containing protein [Burkholderiales bacterium]|nr:HAMP domain-containing protein [Burkholderiales bacterium]
MFVAVATWLYVSGKSSALLAVHRNGELLASALAQTSQFGVVSGNTEALRRSMQHMLQARTDISQIQILDDHHISIATAGQAHLDKSLNFEQPITDDVPDVDLFEGSAPHASTSNNKLPQLRSARVVGYVRVLMSPEPVLKEERLRLLLNALVLLAAAVVSIPLGLYLARPTIRSPFSEMTHALRAVRHGKFDIQFKSKTGGEIGEMQSAFEEMAKGLSITHEEMQQQVLRRTGMLQRAMERLQESDHERRQLMAHSTDRIEEERRRIARELHDQFNSGLLSIRYRVCSLLEQDGLDMEQKEVAAIASSIINDVEKLYDETRQLLKRLRPEALDTLGLTGAIRAAIRTFNETQPACTVDLDAPASELPPLSSKVSITAYRVVQEALSNILKHSQATHGSVSYRFDSEVRLVVLEVHDNGVGFALGQKSAGFGILGMRERVESVGGTMELRSAPGHGTALSFALPEAEPHDA